MECKFSIDRRVTFRTSQNVELAGALVRFTRFLIVFELYNPNAELRLSEVLQDFRILAGEAEVYSGKAVLRNFMQTGPAVVVCEATVNEDGWIGVEFREAGLEAASCGAAYRRLVSEWQKLYQVRPEYKLVLADMQMYFTDLRLWLNQIELGLRGDPRRNGPTGQRELARALADATTGTLSALFERFEEAAKGIEPDLIPAHRVFAKRQLHPLLLCAPFFNRCYVKPLGYAGDYEMVNMMMRDPFEGGSLFAKVMNYWFLMQPPVIAHRNRIDLLAEYLLQAALRAARQSRPARIMSLGCGPAQEVQRFLAEQPFKAEFTLLDFNEETLQHTQDALNSLEAKHARGAQFHFVKKSVHHLLKESGRAAETPRAAQFDLVYCAGLLDYLTQPVCRRLLELTYDWTRPGGVTLATNVHSANPSIGWMELMVDWHLIYRDVQQMRELVPPQAPPEYARVVTEATGVNVFLEVAKPEHA